jgi:2-polyprenyl-6-methoxyphenol hydroxylase-like FAD-dependent oxidoreductase
MTDFDVDLLVLGAGTTGLTLALQAVAHGARVRIVAAGPQSAAPSRTLVVHARSLELLRPLGVTDALLASGDSAPTVRLHLPSRVLTIGLNGFALAGTAFPHPLLIREEHVEEVLAAALAERGVTVERDAEVVRVARLGDGGARATLRWPGRPDDAVRCRYLAGADGPASLVRRSVGGWLGGDYAEEAVLAGVTLGPAVAADGARRTRPVPPVLLEEESVHLTVGRPGVVTLVNGAGAWRLFATRRGAADRPAGVAVPQHALQHLVDAAGLPARLTSVAWSAEQRMQRHIASRFSRGPLFVAGDTAHTFSQVAGQGTNTGIADAVNLGWKLAFAAAAGQAVGRQPAGAAAPPGALAARPGSALLDSYGQERRPADRAVLRLTHAVHLVAASAHPLAQLARMVLVPTLPWLLGRRRIPTAALSTLTQFRLRYAHSPLSMEVQASLVPVRGGLAKRGLRPGSRVADTLVRCGGRRVRLHELLARPGVHILLQAGARPVPERMLGPLVHAYRLDDRPGTGMLVVRPDGHVALRAPVLDETHLTAWLRLVGQPVR